MFVYQLMPNTHEQIPFVKAASRSVPLVQMVKGVVNPLTIVYLHLNNIVKPNNRELKQFVN